ncbi:MAG: DUF2461 domain-containing protein [Gammaproteobacteria bacterium]
MTTPYFTAETLAFLSKLAKNNRRDWFEQHKSVYETCVRGPALAFIADIADELAVISPHFMAQPKKLGGSLMRVHRDIRFARDKTPYKTNIGIQFRHERGKDVHAPGFYLHISPLECFLGVGLWRPESRVLGVLRDALLAHSTKWLAVRNEKNFTSIFSLSGSSLQRAPRGYAADHPLIEDLKRKDFIAISALTQEQVLGARFRELVISRFRVADHFMQFLCTALNLQY